MNLTNKETYSKISLVLGIISLLLTCTGAPFILGPIAIILGLLGKTSENKFYGKSIGGIVTGILSILLLMVLIITLIIHPALGALPFSYFNN